MNEPIAMIFWDGRVCTRREVAVTFGDRCRTEDRVYLSLLKTLNAGETPGFLWLSEF